MKKVPKNKPDPHFIAQQLKKPTGDFATVIARKMNEINSIQYDLVLDSMALKNNECLLEIGFGNGFFFDKLFARAKNLRICGVDFSEEMVDEAQKNNKSSISAGKLNISYGCSDRLPFPDATFDKVFCINVVYFWDQPKPHLDEIYRVLTSGGKFYSVLRTKESSSKLPFTKYGFTLYDRDEWKAVLEQNKFRVSGINQKIETRMSDTDLDKQSFEMESLCFIGEK